MDEKTKTIASVGFYGMLAGLVMVGLPLYLSSLGMNLEQFGLLFGGAAAIAGLAKIWLSAWTDKIGRKKMTALFGALTALTTTSFAFASSLAQFALIKPLQDFSWSFYLSLNYVRMLDLTSLKERGRQLANLYTVFWLSLAAGMLAVGYVLSLASFNGLFLLAGTLGFVSFLFVLAYKESVHRKRKSMHLSFEVLGKREARVYAAKNFLSGTCTALVYSFTLPLFFSSQFSLSAGQIGIVMGSLFIVTGASQYIFRGLLDAHSAIKLAAVGVLLDALIYFGLSFTSTLPLVILLLILDNVFYSLYPAADGKIASQIPDSDDMGRDIMLFDYIYYFGSAAGLFLAGFLGAISFSLVFAARALILLMMFLLLRMLPARLEGRERA